MSDPFLPVPHESEEVLEEQELDGVEHDEQPDVLAGAADDEPGETERDAGAFRAPHAGDRLTGAELEDDLG